MVEFRDDHAFDGPEGRIALPDLFAGRDRLVIRHVGFTPDGRPCLDGAVFADRLMHLDAPDTAFALVSRASQDEIQPWRARLGWTDVPWYSTVGDDLPAALRIDRGAALHVFLRAGAAIYEV